MKNGKDGHETRSPAVIPAGAIGESQGTIRLRLEMPGVRKEGLEIRIEDNQLRITGKRDAEPASGAYIVSERSRGEFSRVFTLDQTIDRDRIDATMENGVLMLTLERRESEKPRRIEVKAG